MSIREFLQGRKVSFQWLLHRPVPGASRFAQSLHVPGRQVAKGVLVRAGDAFVLAVLPSTTRVDLARLSQVLGGCPVRLASEAEVESVFTDCERGAIPPFGRLYGLTTVVDARLAEGADLVCLGNQRHEALRLSFRDFEALVEPVRAHFATEIAPRHERAPSRRAG